MRWLLIPLLLVGCQKAELRSSPAKPYEAQRIRTLTHDEDLKTRPDDLRSRLMNASPSLK